MNATIKVHRYEDAAPGAWDEFIQVMRSGEQFECDEDMFFYWLEVLPPRFMHKDATFADGSKIRASFGFAEGAELITAFWKRDGRFFGRLTNMMNHF